MPSKTQDTKKTKAAPAKAATPERADNKVPEWAEDMEHSLRRLVREKERERAKHPGLYR